MSPSAPTQHASCAACGSALAPDQRYCLQCGERRPALSDFLRAGPPSAAPEPKTPPSPAPIVAPAAQRAGGNPWLPVIAGIGVLLLAMGVGVLIGRAGGNSKAAPAQVITVAGVSPTSATGSGAGEETFTGDWPSSTKGFTIQLQTLPEGSTPAVVAQAKIGATSKGAGAVGALEESSYSSLTGSGYLIYSGVFHTKAQAQKALEGLKSKFPGAKVVEVANKNGSSGSQAGESGGSSSGASSLPKAAPDKALEKLSHATGPKYEQESKNLPNVVVTP